MRDTFLVQIVLNFAELYIAINCMSGHNGTSWVTGRHHLFPYMSTWLPLLWQSGVTIVYGCHYVFMLVLVNSVRLKTDPKLWSVHICLKDTHTCKLICCKNMDYSNPRSKRRMHVVVFTLNTHTQKSS